MTSLTAAGPRRVVLTGHLITNAPSCPEEASRIGRMWDLWWTETLVFQTQVSVTLETRPDESLCLHSSRPILS